MIKESTNYVVLDANEWVPDEVADLPCLYFEKDIQSFILLVKSWDMTEIMSTAQVMESITGFKWDRAPIPAWQHNNLITEAEAEAAAAGERTITIL